MAELTQALMMTSNLREAAALVDDGPKPDQQGYFTKEDYITELLKLSSMKKDTELVNKLLLNLGTQDKASNWLIE